MARGDVIVDVLAAVVLVLSLTLVWNLSMGVERISATRVEVLLVTLLSLVSLTLPYASKAGVLPADWTVITVRKARVLAGVPYAVVVLVHYLISLFGSGHYLAMAVPIGLAGAVLAAQPRNSELGPVHLDSGISTVWVRIFAAFAGLAVVTSVLAFLMNFVQLLSFFSFIAFLQLVAFTALTVAPITIGALGLWRKSTEWAVALGVFGAAVGVAILLGGSNFFPANSVSVGEIFIPAAGAIAVSAVLRRVLPAVGGHELWVRAAVRILEIVLVIAGTYAFLQVLSMIGWMDGTTAARLIVNVLIVVGAVLARNALKSNPVAARPMVLGVAGGTVLGGLVVWIVVSGTGYASLLVVESVAYFLLPAAVVAFLTVPAPVRSFFPARATAPAPAWAQPHATGTAPVTRDAPTPWPAATGATNDAADSRLPASWGTQSPGATPGAAVPWKPPALPTVGTGPAAPPSKRLLAFFLDGVAVTVVVLLSYMFSIAVLGGAAASGSDSAMAAGLLSFFFIPSLVSIAFGIVQLVWEGNQGLTVGNKLMGIRTVTFGTDRAPGIWYAFLRRLIEGLGSLVFVGGPLIAFSAQWDNPARRQGWQDKIAGTEMVLGQSVTRSATTSPGARTSPDTAAPVPPPPATAPPAWGTDVPWPRSDDDASR